MSKGEGLSARACLAALYLRRGPGSGGPKQGSDGRSVGPSRSGLPAVLRALSLSPTSLNNIPDLLRAAGRWEEAALVDAPDVLARAADLCEAGDVLTALDDDYPSRWRDFGSLAPPALWRSGACQGPLVAVVGTRGPCPVGTAAARGAAMAACRQGFAVITGGAWGVDRLALDAAALGGAPRGVVLHPWGLGSADAIPLLERWPWAMHLSTAPLDSGFTTGQAMERNLLIYSGSSGAFVVGPRLREGGTWHGAVEALRRRVCPVAVAHGCGAGKAVAALQALGARVLGAAAPGGQVLGAPDLPSPCSVAGGAASRGPASAKEWSGLVGQWLDELEGSQLGLFGNQPVRRVVQECRSPYLAVASPT